MDHAERRARNGTNGQPVAVCGRRRVPLYSRSVSGLLRRGWPRKPLKGQEDSPRPFMTRMLSGLQTQRDALG
jgi:hypothetical protein